MCFGCTIRQITNEGVSVNEAMQSQSFGQLRAQWAVMSPHSKSFVGGKSFVVGRKKLCSGRNRRILSLPRAHNATNHVHTQPLPIDRRTFTAGDIFSIGVCCLFWLLFDPPLLITFIPLHNLLGMVDKCNLIVFCRLGPESGVLNCVDGSGVYSGFSDKAIP